MHCGGPCQPQIWPLAGVLATPGVSREQDEAEGARWGWPLLLRVAFSWEPHLSRFPHTPLWQAGKPGQGQVLKATRLVCARGGLGAFTCLSPLSALLSRLELRRGGEWAETLLGPDARRGLGRWTPGRAVGVAERCPTCLPTESFRILRPRRESGSGVGGREQAVCASGGEMQNLVRLFGLEASEVASRVGGVRLGPGGNSPVKRLILGLVLLPHLGVGAETTPFCRHHPRSGCSW